jgi:tetratricopeptide (TPR) repeat protein
MRHNGNGNGKREPNEWNDLPTGGFIHELHDYFIDLGKRAEQKGDLESAADLYSEAASADPKPPLAWYNYGDALLALGRSEEAIAPLCKAIQLAPNALLFRYDLGLAFYDLGKYREACSEFSRIVETDPQLSTASSSLVLSAMTNLALSQERLGNRDRAVRTLKPALHDTVGVCFNLGFLHCRAKRYAEALPFLQAAALLKPDDEDIVHELGFTFLELRNLKEALKYLQLATKLNPKCAAAWYDLGLVFARQKRHKPARRYVLRALRLNPKHYWSYYQLACIDALEKKRDSAFEHLEKAAACGFNKLDYLLRDNDFRSLRRDLRWRKLLKTLRDREDE